MSIKEPKEGEIRSGGEIGRKGYGRFIVCKCPTCRSLRWVKLPHFKKHSYENYRCWSCTRRMGRKRRDEECRYKDPYGYIHVWLLSSNKFFQMVAKVKDSRGNYSSGYVREHRLVYAKFLGRCLKPWETVDHKDGNKSNNRLSNLRLRTDTTHGTSQGYAYREAFKEGYVDGLNKGLLQCLKQGNRLN